ncbi:MAG: impB/mucB/samB family protein [Alphaproteobacteria bacterium]|nr:impB/mucB/samB family protein [Alphaproteobacteria bacterium]MBP7758949.1 impB/mucB/samB family protein [Alphaproteobacteria bacterium]MBP7762224.1 impB/mucB/samB family protein [Alphaproteobacteria bacterium]MBP7904199.1 impB/mucB/samB family protein [Alphaproteobacteria bacterium]
MDREPGLKWLFLDLNSYFASVEQQERPHLRGKPVAVVPMETDHTCAIAASYEAKAYGIKTGTMIRDARRMCPNLTCVLARHDKYVEYHHKIVDEIALHAPINKIWSIDELSSRLPPSRRSVEAATELALRIKAGIRKNVGPAITCSIGVAPNSLLAKIAGDMKKPDGLTILRQEDLPGPLFDLKLTDLPGIGENMERRLIRAGVSSIRDFWNISPKHARKIWGSVQGERFWYWLHGYDFETQETGNTMIGHSRILDPLLRTPDPARQMARRLLTKASYRLRRKKFYASRVSLGVRTTEHLRWGRELKISPAQDPFTFLQHLDDLWGEMLQFFEMRRSPSPLRFRKVSVTLYGLSRSGDISYDLFKAQEKEAQEKLRKNDALTRALDRLQDKYQRETVSLGLPPKTLAGYVGTKIAFSRVPDREEFWS